MTLRRALHVGEPRGGEACAGLYRAAESITRLKASADLRGELSLRGRGFVLSTWSYLCREEAKRSTETAGSSGDSRLSIGGNADRKSPVRTRINLESRAEEEAFTLNFYRRGREGAIRKGEERRVLRRQQATLYQVIMQDCSICYNKQQLNS